MSILHSKYYPKFMYLALITISLLIVFNMASIMQDAKIKSEHRGISGFATETDNSTNQTPSQTNEYSSQDTNNPKPQNGEMYSTQSYIFYYILIIGIIAGIFITFSVLKSTVIKNIEKEEKDREF